MGRRKEKITESEMQTILDRYKKGVSVATMAKEYNVNKSYIYQSLRKIDENIFKKPKKEFALYKGDDLLAIGTIEEVAAAWGVKCDTIRFYGTQTYKNRIAKRKSYNQVVLVPIGTEED